MKFRSDFITNSSSGGFLTITIENNKLADLLKENNANEMILILNKDSLAGQIVIDTDAWDEDAVCPQKLDEVIPTLIKIIRIYEEMYDSYIKEHQINLSPLIKQLKENESNLRNGFNQINWHANYAFWGEEAKSSTGEMDFNDKQYTYKNGNEDYILSHNLEDWNNDDSGKKHLQYIKKLDSSRIDGWVNFNNKKKSVVINHNGKAYKVINSSVKYINYLKSIVDGIENKIIAVNSKICINNTNSIQVISSSAGEAKDKIQLFINVCEMISKKDNLGILIDLAEKKLNGTLRVNRITSVCSSDIGVSIHLLDSFVTDSEPSEAVIDVKALSEDELMFGVREATYKNEKPNFVLFTAQEMAEKYKDKYNAHLLSRVK